MVPNLLAHRPIVRFDHKHCPPSFQPHDHLPLVRLLQPLPPLAFRRVKMTSLQHLGWAVAHFVPGSSVEMSRRSQCLHQSMYDTKIPSLFP